ncbi:hypothetical protein D0863_10220 [Hortaea werneckii]|uniref:Myb-like domain-containing protein n=1 Tax=Hortaea werneckii TaxID=91943 RepID=A0A3M7DIP0_HORWE|nr:hypothetical protein D0863_10220 [Hortaea werneckii]
MPPSSAHNNLPPGQVYRPTSLDFINRPNPVEPQSVPQKHPLNGTPQFAKPPSHSFDGFLSRGTDGEVQRSPKRRKSGDGKSLDLPKLPVRQNAKRLRIPPTLSGLHQPPPDAGLLPSISTEQPVAPPKHGTSLEDRPQGPLTHVSHEAASKRPSTGLKKARKSKRNRWSDEETACLLKGVARFGIGNWTAILKCPDYQFDRRTALDLKDRFRVCRPEEYLRTRQPTKTSGPRSTADDSGSGESKSKPRKTDRKSNGELHDLGITQPFHQSGRRKRHKYTAEEDEAILRGFEKFGNSWAAIQADESLHLGHRTSTDLRDRMRTKFPKEYAEAGLAPRPEVFPKPPQRNLEDRHEEPSAQREANNESQPPVQVPMREENESAPTRPRKAVSGPFLPDDNVFFGAPFDNDDMDTTRITLDRDILQWAGQTKNGTIDPLNSLKLPAPTTMAGFGPSHNSGAAGSLPSVADITAVDRGYRTDHLELPSLIMGHFDAESRPGQVLGFDELLS